MSTGRRTVGEWLGLFEIDLAHRQLSTSTKSLYASSARMATEMMGMPAQGLAAWDVLDSRHVASWFLAARSRGWSPSTQRIRQEQVRIHRRRDNPLIQIRNDRNFRIIERQLEPSQQRDGVGVHGRRDDFPRDRFQCQPNRLRRRETPSK